MNIWDILIIIVIAAAVTFAVLKIIKNKKQGKSSCGGDCSNCGMRCGK